MSYEFQDQAPMPLSESQVQTTFAAAMQRVYVWMVLGLFLTAVTAVFTASSPLLLSIIFSSAITFYGLIIGEFILVIAIGRAVAKASAKTSRIGAVSCSWV